MIRGPKLEMLVLRARRGTGERILDAAYWLKFKVAGEPNWRPLPVPAYAEDEFLVFGECRCGWRMAAPEASLWPRCPKCGRRVLPPRSGLEYDPRMGYRALFLTEEQAFNEVAAQR